MIVRPVMPVYTRRALAAATARGLSHCGGRYHRFPSTGRSLPKHSATATAASAEELTMEDKFPPTPVPAAATANESFQVEAHAHHFGDEATSILTGLTALERGGRCQLPNV